MMGVRLPANMSRPNRLANQDGFENSRQHHAVRIHLGEYLKLGVGALPIAEDTQELKQENTRLGVRRIITDPRL
jgi:hypothetical protein